MLQFLRFLPRAAMAAAGADSAIQWFSGGQRSKSDWHSTCSGVDAGGVLVTPQEILRDDAGYPDSLLSRLGAEAPALLHVLGDGRALGCVQLGLVCSVQCPGGVIIRTLDAARELRDAGVVIAGGFHSPMERESLHFLLRGRQWVVLCLAVGMHGCRLRPDEQRAVDEGRLTIVSVLDDGTSSPTLQSASRRNEVVSALAEVLLVPYAVPRGKAESVARRALARRQTVLTFACEENEQLVALGATPVTVAELVAGFTR
jgi:predicted Rossmann fold nucleotide-binding protein DprA/Smf involved in DNA uptake